MGAANGALFMIFWPWCTSSESDFYKNHLKSRKLLTLYEYEIRAMCVSFSPTLKKSTRFFKNVWIFWKL